jgi:DNA-binding MarR family transcriptional regulator
MKTQDLAELSYHLVCLRSLGYRNARERGLAPRECELLPAIKTLPPDRRRGIGELADWLHMQHHGVVELATRLQRRGLLRRYHDQQDGRRLVWLLLPRGKRVLRDLPAWESARLHSCAGEAVSTLQRIVGKLPRNGNGTAGHNNANGYGQRQGNDRRDRRSRPLTPTQ